MKDDFNDLIFKFTERLKVLNRSPSTISAYCMHIKAFWYGVVESIGLSACGDAQAGDIKKITREAIEGYIASLYDYRDKDGKGYSTGTISLKVRSIKRFFEFLEFANIIFVNPAEFIREPKKEKRLPKEILTKKEVSTILDQPNLGLLIGIRDRTILEVFYSTGIRIEELCKLSVYDADLQGGLLRVNKGKGSKDRVIPLGKHAVKFLREYISKVRPKHTRHKRSLRSLFVNQSSRPLDKQVVTIIVRRYAKEAKIKKQVTAHTFRHTFACELIRNGADITAVQKMLGHTTLKVTQQYLRLAGVDVKKNHKQSHPREQDKEGSEVIKPKIARKKPKYDYKRNNKKTD